MSDVCRNCMAMELERDLARSELGRARFRADNDVAALRAALDQERADSAKLRMIFDVMGNNAYCGEVPLDVLIDYGVPEEELDRLLNGPRIDDLPRVSPPTETDLARALEQVRQLTNEVDDLRGWIAAAKKAAAPISALLSGRGEAS